jgi:hypothetical protein
MGKAKPALLWQKSRRLGNLPSVQIFVRSTSFAAGDGVFHLSMETAIKRFRADDVHQEGCLL